MVVCVAYGCTSKQGKDSVAFFGFPYEVNIARKWTENINRVGSKRSKLFEATLTSKLCSLHFTDDQFEVSPSVLKSVGFYLKKRLKLKKGAVPTVFTKRSSDTASTRTNETVREDQEDREDDTGHEMEVENGTSEPQSSQSGHSPLMWLADIAASHLPFEETEKEDPNETTLPYPLETDTGVDNTKTGECTMTSEVQQTSPVVTSMVVQLPLEETALMFNVQCQTARNEKTKSVQVSPKMVDNSTQTDVVEEKVVKLPDCASLNNSLIESELELTREDSMDATYQPESGSDNTDCSFDVTMSSDEADEKFVVCRSQLEQLLKHCVLCSSEVQLSHNVTGTAVRYKRLCSVCEETTEWASQPFSGTMATGNLELSAAIMFAGAGAAQTLKVLRFAGIRTFDISTFGNIQKHYLTPAVLNVWHSEQSTLLDAARASGTPLKLAGDARCDSPGHTAKYGSYSLMDVDTGKVLDFQLVQSNEVKNSCAMELEGLKRSLAFLTRENGLTVGDIITDRHSSVKKFLREELPGTNHWFDVWHVAKGVSKKLENVGRRKGCEKVGAWAKSVSNHMYWCAASSDGDGELVKQKWLSILNHVTNIHEGHGDRFSSCQHDHLDERLWFKKGFRPYLELEKVVNGRLLRTDIKKLSPIGQTSSLEAFHKVVCNFAPKSVHYFHAQMEARLCLAALHFNENRNRNQAATKSGELRFKVSYPKARKKQPVATPVKVVQTFDYVRRLMDEVFLLRQTHDSYNKAKSFNTYLAQRPFPLAHSTPMKALSKSEVVQRQKSRFSKK